MGYINEIKTKDGQKYDIQDKRIIEVTPADVGKVLTVEEDGSLGFKAPAGGTKLYRHKIELSQSSAYPSNSLLIVFITTFNTPLTIDNLYSLIMDDNRTMYKKDIVNISSMTYFLSFVPYPSEGHKATVRLFITGQDDALSLGTRDFDYFYGNDVVTEL